jgi:hypothetical protein
MVGASMSRTVTWKPALEEFPYTSVAVYVTVVVPRENAEPLAWLDSMVEIVEQSLAVADSQLARPVHDPRVESTVILAGIVTI